MRKSLAAAAICVLLAGCASIPMSADAAFGGNPTPGAIASGGATDTRDGVYVGTADVLVNGGYRCRTPMSISNFRVDGDTVRFGGFRGTIAADGSVPQTVFRGMWFTGRFDGPNFVGHVNAFDDSTTLLNACTFAISVTRQTG